MYTSILLVGNLHLEFDDMRQTGLQVRTLIAVYQVWVVTVILRVYVCCLLVLDSVTSIP
jgi:hypothetical protein